MATSGHRLLLRVSLLVGFLAFAANARPGRQFHPCQTLIFFSSSSSFPVDQNPNLPPQNPSLAFSGRRSITFFFTGVRHPDREPKPVFLPSYPQIFVDRAEIDEQKQRPLPFGFHSSVDAPFRHRSKDILSVVGSLLLGIGCGILTAATLYLIWSIFAAHNRFDFRDYDDEFDGDDDVGPKKMGYVAIPAADDPVKKAVDAPAKKAVDAPAKKAADAPAKKEVV